MADSQRFLDTSIVKEARSPWEVYRKGKVHIYKRPACQSKEFWGNRGQSFIIGLMIAASNDSSNALTECLLCARYDVGLCTCPIQFNTHLNSGSGDVSLVPIFQMGKLRLRGLERLCPKSQWYNGRTGDLHPVSGWDLSLTYKMGIEKTPKTQAFSSHLLETF